MYQIYAVSDSRRTVCLLMKAYRFLRRRGTVSRRWEMRQESVFSGRAGLPRWREGKTTRQTCPFPFFRICALRMEPPHLSQKSNCSEVISCAASLNAEPERRRRQAFSDRAPSLCCLPSLDGCATAAGSHPTLSRRPSCFKKAVHRFSNAGSLAVRPVVIRVICRMIRG